MVRTLCAALVALLAAGLLTGTATAEHDVRIEGESLVAGAQATAPIQSQANCCGVQWSSSHQLWFRAGRAGDRATLTLTVPESAEYDVIATMTGAPDYGILRLSLDGVPVGQPFDGYRTSVTKVQVALGWVPLSAGTHELTIEVVGRSGRSTGYFAGLDLLSLNPIGGMPDVRIEPYATTGASVSAGGFTWVYDPSIGEQKQWYYNDHTMIRDVTTGTWHLFGITHPEPADPLDEKQFGHATAPSPRGPWTKRPFALTADPAAGESHIWAPHVIHHDGRYYMFYAAGTPEHSSYRMHLATSTDLNTWTRSPANPLFTDGYDARDPMVVRHDGQWAMFYTATSGPFGGNHQVAYRTSTDLERWTSKRIAFEHPKFGTYGGPTESPFVFERDGWWYLTICCDSGYEDTRVYRSRTPLRFSINDLAGRIPSHAAEIVTEPNGSTWVTGAGWGKGGVYLAPLRLDGTVVARGHHITTPYLRADVRHWPTTEVRSLAADESGTGQDHRDILDASARSTAPYLAVGGWGPTDRARAAARIVISPNGSRIGLLGIPMGNEPVTADWTLEFTDDRLDTSLSWRVTGATTTGVWETALGLDSVDTAMVGNNVRLDLDSDQPGYPRWLVTRTSDVTLVAAYRDGSSWSTDNQWYQRRHGLISMQSLWDAGGRSWPAGVYPGGRWRFGVSESNDLENLGDVLHAEVNSG
ncbi:family 43 glycosylhydrolase [Actinophytocola gossypii]|uniref:Family 43 glycosylhydrolase n=1 Tax=Actinophytocola gossypii TaxID=2812003 RepID=A0ABT2J9J1_9PSEU|nr:family 43 glycosylhydrolase [Actinophytocola gossypii]MCT2584535.1 family 43 glycosylhydrolase [Actinophytocola gossypii]